MKATIIKSSHGDVTTGAIGELVASHPDGAEIEIEGNFTKQDGGVVKHVKETRTLWFKHDEYEAAEKTS